MKRLFTYLVVAAAMAGLPQLASADVILRVHDN